MGLKTMSLAAMLGIAAMALPVSAQPGGGNPGGRRGGGMQMITTALTTAGATADEITKITPLIQDVQTKQQATQVRQFGGGGRNGGNPPPAPTTDLGKAVAELQTTLDNKDAKPDEIKDKLKAVRDAKTKAMEELKKAQKTLTEVLTPKEEAVLVTQGILE